MACPGSVALSEGLPDKSSEFADEGTDAHELAALCLSLGDTPAKDFIGKTLDKGNTVTLEMATAVWTPVLKLAGIRHRAPKECRDTSVTLALMAGANPMWVAAQHGHSVQVMMRDYAKWLPSADKGVNLAAVNGSISGPAGGAREAI